MTTRLAVPALVLALLVSGCSSDASDPTPSPSGKVAVADIEAFCSLIAQGRDLESTYDLNGLSLDMQLAIENAATDHDPVAIAAIQAWGEALGEAGSAIVPVYEDLLALTDDPLLRTGIELSIDMNQDFTGQLSQDIAQVRTITDFQAVMTDFTDQVIVIGQDAELQAAVLYLNDYSIETCGFPLSTSG